MLADELKRFYENEGEEELRLVEGGVQYIEFATACKYLEKVLPPNCSILDTCAGSGIYSYYFAEKGFKVTAGDIVQYNVDKIEEKQRHNNILEMIYLGDNMDLSRFEDKSFDAIFCMGALYHLMENDEREKAVSESLRVLKNGGIFVASYMNRYSVIMNNSIGDLSNIDEIMEFSDQGSEGVFYASTPEEIENLMQKFNLEKLYHIGLDGMGLFMHDTSKLIDDEGLKRWQQYHLKICEVPSLLGTSYHGMIICKKVENNK